MPPLIIVFLNGWSQGCGRRRPFVFSDPLIVSPVFSLLSGGKCDKVALSLPLPLTVFAVSQLGVVVGGGRVSVGTRPIVLHEVRGRSDLKKINEETALLPQTLFLPARILWEESGYHGPQKGGSLTWQIEGWGRRLGGESKRDLAGGKCEMCRCVFKTALSRISSYLQKRHCQSLHLYSHILLTRAVAKVSFQTLVGFTCTLMSSVHELYKEPWGAALMFPFLCFLSVVDITDWKCVSKSHTGCKQRESFFFFFWSVRLNLVVWDRSCWLFCTKSPVESLAFFNSLSGF